MDNQFNMGIGYVGDPKLRFARKMRWTIEFHHSGGPITPAAPVTEKMLGPYLINMAARPSMSIEETEVNFLHERIYLSGKPQYEQLNMTIYDVAQNSEMARWLYEVYKFGKHGRSGPMSETRWYKWNGFLTMFDGEGYKLQEWILYGAWPTQVNWGDLDMSSSETANIEVTLRYDSMDLIYTPEADNFGNLATYPPGTPTGGFDSATAPFSATTLPGG